MSYVCALKYHRMVVPANKYMERAFSISSSHRVRIATLLYLFSSEANLITERPPILLTTYTFSLVAFFHFPRRNFRQEKQKIQIYNF